MFSNRLALAAAGALMLSGCAAGTWQRAADHPADPAAAPGFVNPATVLERYRATQSSAPAPSTGKGKASPEDAHSHHDHGDQDR